MEFTNRDEFRKWLCEHCLSSTGIWLLFGKAGGPQTIKAAEALEEALCFGWIDGQMLLIDEQNLQKIFFHAKRTKQVVREKQSIGQELRSSGTYD